MPQHQSMSTSLEPVKAMVMPQCGHCSAEKGAKSRRDEQSRRTSPTGVHYFH